VPKLWHYLAQLNLHTNVSFPCVGPSGQGPDLAHLVIDGPSFAYWFWRERRIKQGFSEWDMCADEEMSIRDMQRIWNHLHGVLCRMGIFDCIA